MPIQSNVRLSLLAATIVPGLALLTGCDFFDEHVEVRPIEMKLEHFNRTSSTFEALTPPATKRLHAFVVTVNGKLFFVGGANSDYAPAPEVEIYDPVSATYELGTAWYYAEHARATLVVGDHVCVAIGEGATANFRCYDTLAKTWKLLWPFPETVRDHIAPLGNLLYVISEDFDGLPGKPAFTLDLKTDMKKDISNYPGDCWPTHFIGVETMLYVLPCSEKTPIYRYDPSTNEWTSMPLPAMDNQQLAAHLTSTTILDVVGGEIIGYDPSKTSGSTIAIFSPAKYDEATMTSGVRFAAPPPGIWSGRHTSVATSDAYWISTTLDDSSLCGAVHSYVPATDTWTLHVQQTEEMRLCYSTLGVVGEDIFLLTSLQERLTVIK